MGGMTIVIGFVGYAIFLLLYYYFIIKRLKKLNQKHISYTKVEEIRGVYDKLHKVIIFLFLIVFVLSIFITLNFFYVK